MLSLDPMRFLLETFEADFRGLCHFFPLDLVMIIFSTLPKTFGRLELFPFSTLPVFLYWAHHLSIVLNGTSRSLATSCYLISASIIPTARPLTSKLCCFIFSDIDILDDEIKQVLVYCTAKKTSFQNILRTYTVQTIQIIVCIHSTNYKVLRT